MPRRFGRQVLARSRIQGQPPQSFDLVQANRVMLGDEGPCGSGSRTCFSATGFRSTTRSLSMKRSGTWPATRSWSLSRTSPRPDGNRRRLRAARRGGPADHLASPRGLAHSSLHLRRVHCRTLESVCPCGLSRGGRSAVTLVQPAVHLRRRRPGQDALDARDRALRSAAHAAASAHLHLVRALHERDDQRGAL